MAKDARSERCQYGRTRHAYWRRGFGSWQIRVANIAFPNARGYQMARDGVEYILRQAVQRASQSCPTLATRAISPHVVRHATATHLLQSGVDIAVIALWLGHESIE